MMDEFAEKRGMVKMLMDMLKNSAAKEVSDGMPKPEDGKGLAIEKVSVIPHKDGDMPDDAMRMADGGMAMDSDQPDRMIMPPAQDADGSADEEAMKNMADGTEKDKEMEDEDEDNNSSSFSAFMRRGKK